jgi:SAM-dependent methyltransferase
LKFQYIQNTCPLCGQSNGTHYHCRAFAQGDITWVQCSQDDLIYQDPRLDDDSIQALFNSGDYAGATKTDSGLGYYRYEESEPARLAMGRTKAKMIEARFQPGALKILEIGCATGSFLQACKERGHSVVGVDVSGQLAQYGINRYGLDIVVGAFENAGLGEAKFNVIVMLGSLSCLNDPVRCFKKMSEVLEPGGIVIFNTPILDGWVAKLYGKKLWMFRPSIQVLYTKTTVRKLLEKTGFELVELKRDVQAVSVEKLALVSGMRFLGRVFGRLRKLYWTVPLPSVIQVVAKVKIS